MQLTKAYVDETSCNHLYIGSATYLLKSNSPDIDNIAVSLYGIDVGILVHDMKI